MLMNYIIQPFGNVLNNCVNERIYPTGFEKNLVIPINQNGDDSDIGKYQPIHLPNVKSILETN